MDIHFGYISLIFALAFGVLYLLGRRFKIFLACINRDASYIPKERVGFYLPLFILLGFVFGSIFYTPIERGIDCYKSDKRFIGCYMNLKELANR